MMQAKTLATIFYTKGSLMPVSKKAAPTSTGAAVKPPGANITVAPARQYTLVGGKGTSYDFYPRGEVVLVVHHYGLNSDRYEMPLAEARALYLRLLNKGYEVF